MSALNRSIFVASLTAALTIAGAATATAAVTIGQLPSEMFGGNCGSDTDRAQISVTEGRAYTVPSAGGVTDWILTSWSHDATSGEGQELTMKVFRKVSDPLNYMVVGHHGPVPLTPNRLNTFPAGLRVRAGDVLGSNGLSPEPTACRFGAPGETFIFRTPGLIDGQQAGFGWDAGSRLNISAEVTPTNLFTLGATTRNKKNGTATLAVTVPNPGDLRASGKEIRAPRRSLAVTPGSATLLIKAKGKKKRKLRVAGKVRVNVSVSYTPTGGVRKSEPLRVKLIRRLRPAG